MGRPTSTPRRRRVKTKTLTKEQLIERILARYRDIRDRYGLYDNSRQIRASLRNAPYESVRMIYKQQIYVIVGGMLKMMDRGEYEWRRDRGRLGGILI